MRTIPPNIALIILLAATNSVIAAGPEFEDVTQAAGIAWDGTYTFAVAWGDYNSDGVPDLMLSPHGYNFDTGRIPSLYINQGDGRFVDQGKEFFAGLSGSSDTHGVQWADIDNDGDQDLLVLVGADLGLGEGLNLQFENSGARLHSRIADPCIEDRFGRGRAGVMHDTDLDGNLDATILNARRPDNQAPSLIVQQDGWISVSCSQLNDTDPLAPARAALIVDVDGDSLGDLIVLGSYRFPLMVQAGQPSTNRRLDHLFPVIEAEVGETTSDFRDHDGARDVAVADLTGDLRREVVITRAFHGAAAPNYAVQPNVKSVLLRLDPDDVISGVSFRTTGVLTVEFGLRPRLDFSRDLVTCGSAMQPIESLSFDLDPDNPDCHGLATELGNTRRHLAVGYDTASAQWTIQYKDRVNLPLQLRVSSANLIEDLLPVGDLLINPGTVDLAVNDSLWQYDENVAAYIAVDAEGLTNVPTLSRSIAAGDFDNDMDVDIVAARSSSLRTDGISIWENLGDGRFIERPLSNTGPDLPHDLEYGVGTKIAVADYDLDGYLDVFSSATAWKGAVNAIAGSPPRLLRNLGGSEHWLHLDLTGRYSNRDAVGAVVYAHAGGTVQVRDVGAGNHLFAQNARRVHFGLGQYSRLESLDVHWPSGIWQRHEDLAGDQFFELTEGIGTDGIDHVTGTRNAEDFDVGGGDDVVQGGAGDDVLRGRGGHDDLYGQSGDDTLHGHNGADRLYGGGGADIIRAGPGNDLLVGGPGPDRTWGGFGADRFLIRPGHSTATEGEEDEIRDFDASAGDRVDLRPLGPLEFIGNALFSGKGEPQLRSLASECCNESQIEADTDGDAVADYRIILPDTPPVEQAALMFHPASAMALY